MTNLIATLLSSLVLAHGVALFSLPIMVQESEKESMLLKAAKNNDTIVLKDLISSGMDLDANDGKQRTPLMLALYEKHTEAARILITAGANVNALDDMLNSPFLYAGASGQLEIVSLCLSHNADFDVVNRYGGTALIPAAEKGHVEVVALLANTENYPIDHINTLGWTALLEAIILSDGGSVHQNIVALLIEAGADVNIADNDGITPLIHARKRGFEKIEQALIAADAR